MKKRLFKSIIAMTLFGTSVICSANPCQPIAQACMQEGYTKGAPVGKRLIKDCVIPITQKRKMISNTTFTDDALHQCAALIAKKMGN